MFYKEGNAFGTCARFQQPGFCQQFLLTFLDSMQNKMQINVLYWKRKY